MGINEKIIFVQLFVHILIYIFCDDRHNDKGLSSVN